MPGTGILQAGVVGMEGDHLGSGDSFIAVFKCQLVEFFKNPSIHHIHPFSECIVKPLAGKKSPLRIWRFDHPIGVGEDGISRTYRDIYLIINDRLHDA